MDNQHRKIKGYRELSQEEIDLMNKIKLAGPELEQIVNDLFKNEATDDRWVAIGKTQLQQGLMSLTRSIAKPDFFLVNKVTSDLPDNPPALSTLALPSI